MTLDALQLKSPVPELAVFPVDASICARVGIKELSRFGAHGVQFAAAYAAQTAEPEKSPFLPYQLDLYDRFGGHKFHAIRQVVVDHVGHVIHI